MFDEENKEQQNAETAQPEKEVTPVQETTEPVLQEAEAQEKESVTTNQNVMSGQEVTADQNVMTGQETTTDRQQADERKEWNSQGAVMGDRGLSGDYRQNEYRYGRSYYQNQPNQGQNMSQQNQSYRGQNMSQSGQPYTGQNMSQQNQPYTGQNMFQQNQPYRGQNMSQQSQPGAKKNVWLTVGKVAVAAVLVMAVGSASAIGTVKLINEGRISAGTEDSTVGSFNRSGSKNNQSSTTKGASSVSTVSASTAVVTDVSEMVAKTMPSVVSITNVGTVSYSGFFGSMGTYEAESNGSGIIIGQTEEELLVVTNQHVVSGADTLKVIFIDEESCEANVKGTDAEKDLAVIAVPISSLKEETLDKIKVATLGDSDALNVGEPAIAIGNALGYGQSVTLGVISAKDREVTTENSTNKLIQTDAAINPGNSGGALLNIAGEVIGINSVKYSSTEVEGMGYAIPISDATPIINDLMNKETKTKVDAEDQSYLGVSGVDITSDVSQSYNMPKGVYVTQVVKNSPAEEAGIQKGDIITKIADVSVTSFDELKAELEYHAAGTKVMIELQTQAKGSYGYETKKIEVTLAKKDD